MEIGKLIAKTTEHKELAEVLSHFIGKSYHNHSIDMSIITSESYRFRNNSTQLNMVVIKCVDDICQIDIIAAAGGTGIFNISWWSESGFVKSTTRKLKEICEKNEIELEEYSRSF